MKPKPDRYEARRSITDNPPRLSLWDTQRDISIFSISIPKCECSFKAESEYMRVCELAAEMNTADRQNREETRA